MKVKELLEKLKDVNPEAYIGIEILSNMENSNAGVCNGTIAFDEIKIEDNWVTLIPWQKLIRLPRLPEPSNPWKLLPLPASPDPIDITPKPWQPTYPIPSPVWCNQNLNPRAANPLIC